VKTQLNIRVRKETKDAAKVAAAKAGVTISELVEKILLARLQGKAGL
jgi:antitoxin component of RelBE/YafQ-DinJ toxin-antitoxin module